MPTVYLKGPEKIIQCGEHSKLFIGSLRSFPKGARSSSCAAARAAQALCSSTADFKESCDTKNADQPLDCKSTGICEGSKNVDVPADAVCQTAPRGQIHRKEPELNRPELKRPSSEGCFRTSVQGLWAASQRGGGLFEMPENLTSCALGREVPTRRKASADSQHVRHSSGGAKSSSLERPLSPSQCQHAGRLGMVHGLWGWPERRETSFHEAHFPPPSAVCHPPLPEGEPSDLIGMTDGSFFLTQEPCQDVYSIPIRRRPVAKRFAQDSAGARRACRKKPDRSSEMRPEDGYAERRFDLVEALNNLRRRGDELAQRSEEPDDEGEVTLLERIFTTLDDTVDQLTATIEELMDLHDKAKKSGAAQHATMHLVKRCILAAQHKRGNIMSLEESIDRLKAHELPTISSLRKSLVEHINSDVPTSTKDGIHPDHQIAREARKAYQHAIDECSALIVAFAGSTHSADDIEARIKAACKVGVPKDHPNMQQAHQMANDLREGERLRQRKAAQDKVQADLRAKQATEDRARQEAAAKVALQKKTKSNMALIRSSLKFLGGKLKIPNPAANES